MAQSEGAAVRQAYDGPKFDHDQLLDFITERNREDSERASSAGESRQLIGEFVDETGINAKALSVLRAIAKAADKKPEKAMDMIRSLERGIPMLKNHINGQQSEMDLEPSELPPVPERVDTYTPGANAEIDKDTDDFEQHLAEVAGQDEK